MSAQSMPFESISLEPSVAKIPQAVVLTDISDDNLDPNDFLSQSQALDADGYTSIGSHLETSLEAYNRTNSPETPMGIPSEDATPTLSNSLNLSLSRDSLFQSFYFRENLNLHSQADNNTPLEHLLQRHQELEKRITSAMAIHKKFSQSGEDCSGARTAIGELFAMLSENSLSLREVYEIEASRAKETLQNFQSWDNKRGKVLSRIKQIRSEKNEYGAKLSGLLERRTGINTEIDELEARLASLRASRSALDTEVDKTMSVLESKSAKYVNIFRNLEKIGVDAVRDYLGSDNADAATAGPLLRFENVHAMFTPKTPTPSDVDSGLRSESNPEPFQTGKTRLPSPKNMGAQAIEISNEFGQNSHPNTSPFQAKDPHSAYEKGYAKGSEQLRMVKKRLSTFLQSVVPPPERSLNDHTTERPLGDVSNTITRKLDLEPIVELISSKYEALNGLIIRQSKATEQMYRHGAVWSEMCNYLDKQEEALSKSLAEDPSALDAEKLLQHVYSYLIQKLEDENKSSSTHRVRGERNYLRMMITQELLTVATALDQMSGKDTYVSSIQASNSSPAASLLTRKEPKDLRYSITSISSRPIESDSDAFAQVRREKHLAKPQDNKDIKNE